MTRCPPGPVVAVVGPTAVGKSEFGIDLARALGGEVVNADSMQLYRGMDIGTAKLPPAERRGVPHHLLDIWDVVETANVAAYQGIAREVIDRLLAAGRTPVLVGGSGLYVRAALDALTFPGTDEEVRARLEGELAALGAPALHCRLTDLDPVAAEQILPTNGRRIVRALEVVEITGAPFRASLPRPRAVYDVRQVGLDLPLPALDERIAARVGGMFDQGLVEEVRRLAGQGLGEGRTAGRALGYAQVLRLLAGELDEAAAQDETAAATRKFARRQRSWFRRDPRVHWLDPAAPGLLPAALAAVRSTGAR